MSDTAGEHDGDELVELRGADLGDGLKVTDAVAQPTAGPHAHLAMMALGELEKLTAMSRVELLAQIPELGSGNALINVSRADEGYDLLEEEGVGRRNAQAVSDFVVVAVHADTGAQKSYHIHTGTKAVGKFDGLGGAHDDLTKRYATARHSQRWMDGDHKRHQPEPWLDTQST